MRADLVRVHRQAIQLERIEQLRDRRAAGDRPLGLERDAGSARKRHGRQLEQRGEIGVWGLVRMHGAGGRRAASAFCYMSNMHRKCVLVKGFDRGVSQRVVAFDIPDCAWPLRLRARKSREYSS